MDAGSMRAPGTDRLQICILGEERCQPGHQYGPAVRGCYLIHYVASGRGVFMADGHTYELHAGQGFMISPGHVTTYRADSREPWHYMWIGYCGGDSSALTRRAGLSAARPVFTQPDIEGVCAILREAREDMRALRLGDMSAVGCLMRLLARIGETGCPDKAEAPDNALMEYYRKAAWYIEGNLAQGVRVTDVAAYVGLCRSQLYRVFCAAAGVTPQQWIQRARLRQAQELMRSQGGLTLAEIAASCGYSGAAQMADAFRRFEHTTPGEYRRRSADASRLG